MRAILNTVKTLSRSSPKTEWAAAESQLLTSLKTFDRSAFIEAATHFSQNEQGSQEFWRQIQHQAARNIKTFNSEEVADIALAIGSQENIDPNVEKVILEALDLAVEEEIERRKRKDPYYEAKLSAQMDSSVAPLFRFAANIQTNDDLSLSNFPTERVAAPAFELEDKFDSFESYVNAQEKGTQPENDVTSDGRVILDAEGQEALRRYKETFAKELKENESNERFDIWSLFKTK